MATGVKTYRQKQVPVDLKAYHAHVKIIHIQCIHTCTCMCVGNFSNAVSSPKDQHTNQMKRIYGVAGFFSSFYGFCWSCISYLAFYFNISHRSYIIQLSVKHFFQFLYIHQICMQAQRAFIVFLTDCKSTLSPPTSCGNGSAPKCTSYTKEF
jgi:hypothetical protein